ncbi:hypothetical protein HAX54_048709 [Datura stramonium]|uniref:Uncharacterized protein n=1 Tax=Datura stramonium TaxID=4076 RepID=A0ABS8WLZ0_DATST|nr:hypothetical protein [Datura stramonium]
MEEFYITFKEKCIIHAEAQFYVESFKTACPDIYHQIGMRDCGPFTIPIDPYFLRKAKQQATTLPFLTFVRMLCMRVACPLLRSLDRTIRVHRVITLDTKTDKEAPMIKRARYTGNMTPPSPLASSHIVTGPANADESQNSPPPDLLNIEQREKMHENQLVRLAKAIPSMIQSAFKKAL